MSSCHFIKYALICWTGCNAYLGVVGILHWRFLVCVRGLLKAYSFPEIRVCDCTSVLNLQCCWVWVLIWPDLTEIKLMFYRKAFFFLWQLPLSEQWQALLLPGELFGRLTSRVVARTIRSSVSRAAENLRMVADETTQPLLCKYRRTFFLWVKLSLMFWLNCLSICSGRTGVIKGYRSFRFATTCHVIFCQKV